MSGISLLFSLFLLEIWSVDMQSTHGWTRARFIAGKSIFEHDWKLVKETLPLRHVLLPLYNINPTFLASFLAWQTEKNRQISRGHVDTQTPAEPTLVLFSAQWNQSIFIRSFLFHWYFQNWDWHTSLYCCWAQVSLCFWRLGTNWDWTESQLNL